MLELRATNRATVSLSKLLDADIDQRRSLRVASAEATTRALDQSFEELGIPASARAGTWITGLSLPFAERYTPWHGSWVEQFDKDAFDRTLEEVRDSDHAIAVCADHNCSVTMGLLAKQRIADDDLTEEGRARHWVRKEDGEGREAGLYFLARVAEFAGSPGMTVYEQVKRGVVDGVSIGFRVRKVETSDYKEGAPVERLVKDVDLYEESAVDMPAFTRTWIEAEQRHAEERGKIYSGVDMSTRCACGGTNALTGTAAAMIDVDTLTMALANFAKLSDSKKLRVGNTEQEETREVKPPVLA